MKTFSEIKPIDWVILTILCLALVVIINLVTSGHEGFCVTIEGDVEIEDNGTRCFKTPFGSSNYSKYLYDKYYEETPSGVDDWVVENFNISIHA